MTPVTASSFIAWEAFKVESKFHSDKGTREEYDHTGIRRFPPAVTLEAAIPGSTSETNLTKPAVDCEATSPNAAPPLTSDGNKPPEELQLSEPDSPKRWAKIFGGITPRTFVRRCKEGRIRHKKLSDRSYQVDIRDIPAG